MATDTGAINAPWLHHSMYSTLIMKYAACNGNDTSADVDFIDFETSSVFKQSYCSAVNG